MAVNGASHNIPGEKTGPVTGPPPVLDFGTKQDLLGVAHKDPIGQQAPAVPPSAVEGVGQEGAKGERSDSIAERAGCNPGDGHGGECHVKWKGKDMEE